MIVKWIPILSLCLIDFWLMPVIMKLLLQHEKEAKHSEDVVTSNTSNEKEAVVDEYKAKLAENRKLARAKAEHEAEEDRLKQEEIR